MSQPPDDDRTLIMPTPGGRGRPAPASPPGAVAPPVARVSAEPVKQSGLNPLLAAANPLLNLVPRLRSTLQHPDPATLREQLAQALTRFDTEARAAGIANEKVIAARYAVCTLLDETAASTPWGGSGVWARHSLLVQFHNEAWGGEKFFQLLARLAEAPAANRDLLALMYVCLALGLQGRYAVAQDGRSQLEALRERLAQLLRGQAGDYERELSPRWAAVEPVRKSVLSEVPLWIGLAATAVVLLLVYLGFSYALNSVSDPVYAQTLAARIAPPARAAPSAPAAAAPPRLARFLEREIAAGLVAVRDEGASSVVTLRGDGLFAPGSATVEPDFRPLLLRIADALNDMQGPVLVSGHSDSQPIRSLKFPSNWHLSNARAEAVAQLLATRMAPQRIRAEGRAEAEPVAANDTPAGRARNRRVEIELKVAATGDSPAPAAPREPRPASKP